MIDRLFILGAVGATAGAAFGATPNPWAWIAPIACGCSAALLVRGIAITTPSKQKRVWAFEILVTALTILLTGVMVEERGLSVMYATLTGIGVGGMGVGVISIARTAAITLVTNLAKSILSAQPPAQDDPPPNG